jgi:pilus assembly protein CpaB
MIKGMTMSKGGSRLPLILGLILGLVAAVLVVVYLTSAKDEGSSTGINSEDGVPTVVAARDILAGTRLTPGDLEVASIPRANQLVGIFGNTEGLAGQVTKVPLLKGEQISQNKVTGTTNISEFGSNPPLALIIDPGQRAVSIELSSVIGAGGNIRPGDFVDVVLIVQIKPESASAETSGTSDQLASTIIQNVKVLAVDQTKTNPNAEASSDPDKAKQADQTATTLTLGVAPVQGEILAMGEVCAKNHGGRLTVSLRGVGDGNALSNRTQWPADGPPPTCAKVLGVSSLGQ